MYRDKTLSTVQRCKINTKILYKLDKYKKRVWGENNPVNDDHNIKSNNKRKAKIAGNQI